MCIVCVIILWIGEDRKSYVFKKYHSHLLSLVSDVTVVPS